MTKSLAGPVPGPALITGASAGIGAGFARKLAARGHDLVLTARRKDRLDAVAADIRDCSGVRVDVVVGYLSAPSDNKRLERLIEERGPFDFLINNAGFGTTGHFTPVKRNKHLDMLRVHAEATMRFTHAALPAMLAARRGSIINVSSVAGIIRVPGSTTYCSTKAFLNAFSETLAIELEGTGVRVQALCPGFTVTEFHDREEFVQFKRSSVPRYMWMTVHDVVSISLRDLARGKVICVAGLRYKLLVLLARRPWLLKVFRPLIRSREQVGAPASD